MLSIKLLAPPAFYKFFERKLAESDALVNPCTWSPKQNKFWLYAYDG